MNTQDGLEPNKSINLVECGRKGGKTAGNGSHRKVANLEMQILAELFDARNFG
jgi:hypothetical protein